MSRTWYKIYTTGEPHRYLPFIKIHLSRLMQAASEKREAMEKKLRAKLEDEVKQLREEGGGTNTGNPASSIQDQDMEILLRKLSHSEEKVSKENPCVFLYILFIYLRRQVMTSS